jgi:GTPase
VNKADRDGTDRTVHDLRQLISLERREVGGPGWRPPVVRTVATTGSGIDEVLSAIEAHHDWMVAHGELEARRMRRAGAEIEAISLQALRSRLSAPHGGDTLDALAKRVVAGELDPYAAADALIATMARG